MDLYLKIKSDYKKFLLAIGIVLFSFMANGANAASIGDIVTFNVDKNFDVSSRSQVASTLIKIGSRLYFYADKAWWDSQSQEEQTQFSADLENLSLEFDNKIYPAITSNFGYEWSPGIDKDTRITVLFQPMNSSEGGYFREADEYEKLQIPNSNEREILYLSTSSLKEAKAKITLAHEFVHLVTFNQKNRIYGAEEDTWLNEARADYSSTLLGYDDIYVGSNLKSRVNDFIDSPSDSVTEWQGTKYDYASASLFTHYLVDHYGINVLSESLKSKSAGIQSINEALKRSGRAEDFSKIFTDWAVTLAINNCSYNKSYCYLNANLKNLRISPTLIFLPLSGSSSLTVTDVTKNWSGNWQKIIGGTGDLRLSFSGSADLRFQVPYIIYEKDGTLSVKYFQLDNDQKGKIEIKDFGTKYSSLIVMPLIQSKLTDFDNADLIYPYSFTVSIDNGNSVQSEDQITIQKLLAQIEALKKQIADILASRQGNTGVATDCAQITSNLSAGMTGSQVVCLQQFLKNQGSSVYPEGYVTGNFGNLTIAAVKRFQEKYASEILTPIGLSSGTGYVGSLTRAKINQLIK